MRMAFPRAMVLVCLIATPARADTHTQEEIAADRRDAVARLFLPDHAEVAAQERRLCFLGEQPQKVAKDRSEGAYFIPDPADTCVAALTRLGRDRQLEAPYKELVVALGGSVGAVASLPRAMGAVVMNGRDTVALGNGKGARVKPAMAFDAGFTVAYEEGAALPAGATDAAQIKTVTESCLGEQLDAGTCFSVGYLQGARAYHGQMAARR